MPATAYPNWFAPYAQKLFERHLTPLAGKPGLRFLQIGAFTGDASVWLLDNILTGSNSWLVDVDTWAGSDEPEHAAFDWSDVSRVYSSRVEGRTARFRCTSDQYFADQCDGSPVFDFIYVDGDHTPYGVLRDAVNAYEVLKVGGLLAFDDYQWVAHHTGVGPGLAVDAIEACYQGRLRVTQLGPQAWFRKIA